MGKNDGLRLYIGHQRFGSSYFINTRGEQYINNHAIVFGNMDSLLKHLKENYKKRKAMLVAIDNGANIDEQEEILETIKKNNLKINISKVLENKLN